MEDIQANENGISINSEAQLYKQIALRSTVGIIVSDAQTHEVYYTNRAFREMMHIGEEHSPGELCFKYVRGLSSPCENCAALKLKQNESCETVNHFPEFGAYINTKSVLISWEGRPALMEYNTDITEEYLLHTRETDLLNRVPNGIGIYELEHGLIKASYLNDSYYRMVRQPREAREEILSTNAAHFIHPDNIETVQARERFLKVMRRKSEFPLPKSCVIASS